MSFEAAMNCLTTIVLPTTTSETALDQRKLCHHTLVHHGKQSGLVALIDASQLAKHETHRFGHVSFVIVHSSFDFPFWCYSANKVDKDLGLSGRVLPTGFQFREERLQLVV